MIMSPGAAVSIADWMVSVLCSTYGFLPPTVTVTVSIDDWPLPALMANSPHWAGEPLYRACCGTAQGGMPPGTVTVSEVSVQVVIGAGTPPIVTLDVVLQVALLGDGAGPPRMPQGAPNP